MLFLLALTCAWMREKGFRLAVLFGAMLIPHSPETSKKVDMRRSGQLAQGWFRQNLR